MIKAETFQPDPVLREKDVKAGTLDRAALLYKGVADYGLMSVTLILLIIGVVMVYSASFVDASQRYDDPAYFLWRELLWVGLGVAGMLVLSRIDYHRWRSWSIALMVVTLGMLLGVLVLPAPFSVMINGSKRWLHVFLFFDIQPSEFAKFAIILYGAHWLSSKGEKVRRFTYGLIPFAITVGILIALVMGEPDLGTSVVLGMMGLVMFFVAGANLLHLVGGLSLAGISFYIFVHTAAYRLDRLKAYDNPWSDPLGVTYHTANALIALGSGGLFGRGLGGSIQKYLWLPEVQTDSIFAVLGEELGLVGAVGVLTLFVLLGWRGFRIALHAPDGFGRLVATGITTYIVGQTMLNIAVITNTVPFTGIPMPFISYGGASMIVTLCAVGILLNISRQAVVDPAALEREQKMVDERENREWERQQRLERAADKQRKLAEAQARAARERAAARSRIGEERAELEREANERMARQPRYDDPEPEFEYAEAEAEEVYANEVYTPQVAQPYEAPNRHSAAPRRRDWSRTYQQAYNKRRNGE